ncbi:MAG: DUF1003 domain-containing protein [Rhizobiaceae bacterium]|nr:DUF1003 domain-containing protein [Rhizobiaceae bacterium]
MKKTVDDLASQFLDATEVGIAETKVLRSAIDRKALSHDAGAAFERQSTLGERLADGIARVGGSWSFIVSFLLFLVVWTAANAWLLGAEQFDPYPFVFLNLVLSMLAAIQAPIIMMSQNRQAARDRVDAAHDYEVNLKAEIEIMALHEKLDELRHRELVKVHDDVARMAEAIARIEARLVARPS